MARKNQEVNYEGKSSAKLNKLAAAEKSHVHQYTLQINRLSSELSKATGVKSDAEDSFGGKNSDYQKASKKADELQKQIDTAQERAKNSKSSEVKQNALDKANDLMKERKQYVAQMDKITNNNSKAKLKMAKANGNIKEINSALSTAQKLRGMHEGKLSKIKHALEVIDEQRRNKIAKKNKSIINQKIKDGGKGYIYIYRADGQSSDVIQLVESDPSESGSVNISTATVDTQLPTASYGVPDSRQLSGTYRLIDGDTMNCDGKASRAAIYEQIIHYANTLTELRITGFTKWKHAFISSYGKQADVPSAKNTTIISLTFDFLMLSKIETSKKKKAKSKGKKSKNAGRASRENPNRTKSIKIKSGDTMVSIAQRMHVSVSDIESANKKYKPTGLPVGGKMVI